MTASGRTAGIYLLAKDHEEEIQRLVSDAGVAAGTRIPHPYPDGGAREYIVHHLAAREAGTAWTFAIMDRGALVGVCGIQGIGGGRAEEIGYWIGRPHWGRGYASFGVKMVLEFAFTNLNLERVGALTIADNRPSRRVLEKNGFECLREEHHPDPLDKGRPDRVALYSISRIRWLDLR